MDKTYKRTASLRQIRNSVDLCAKKGIEISYSKLISEICRVYEVSRRTAQTYLEELKHMGYLEIHGDTVVHSDAEEIRMIYLEGQEKIDSQNGSKRV